MADRPMYEAFAADYAAHAAESPYNALYDRPAVLELIGDVDGRVVLDAGCGPGLYAETLVARGARVIGFDQSPTLISLALERLGPGVDLRVHDLRDPLAWLPDASVDVVLVALVLNYLDDRVAVLRELRRVLRPDGVLVLSTTHPTADWLREGGSYFDVVPVEGSLITDRDWPVRAWRRPLSAVCEEFRAAGLAIERLLEPRPVEEMARRHPKTYARLERGPGFVAFRLVHTPVR